MGLCDSCMYGDEVMSKGTSKDGSSHKWYDWVFRSLPHITGKQHAAGGQATCNFDLKNKAKENGVHTQPFKVIPPVKEKQTGNDENQYSNRSPQRTGVHNPPLSVHSSSSQVMSNLHSGAVYVGHETWPLSYNI